MHSAEVELAQIVADLGGELVGSPVKLIRAIASLDNATSSDISFLSSPKYAFQFLVTRAACVIVRRSDWEQAKSKGFAGNVILTDEPYAYYARLTQWWKKRELQRSDFEHKAGSRIHPTAVIHPRAHVASDVVIGPFCVIEANASVDSRSVLKSRVTLGPACHVGRDCLIHSGAVIGADGFGFAPNRATGEWIKIEQLGGVQIGHGVEIGANTCIDRGALGDTLIGDGVKLDNLIQIGHNVRIGPHTAMAGCVGIAGSATIGAYCTVGGGAIVLGHLNIVDHVHISAASVVSRSINKAGNYTGFFPLDENSAWEKNAAMVKRLSTLRRYFRDSTPASQG